MPAPAWEVKAKDNLKAFLKKNTKALQALLERDAVEADTRTFVTDLMVEGLGFDKYDELTAEYLVRGEFADIGIRVDKKLLAFVEIKRVSTDLKDSHLRQVKNYAANEGVEWVILTNGRIWQVYHVSNTTPIEHHMLFEVDLLAEATPAKRVEQFWLIGRDPLKKGVLATEWKAQSALQTPIIRKAILSDPVLAAIRAQVRKQTGQLVDAKKLEIAVEQISSIK
jgi:predicted type IV restriction endonuclease